MVQGPPEAEASTSSASNQFSQGLGSRESIQSAQHLSVPASYSAPQNTGPGSQTSYAYQFDRQSSSAQSRTHTWSAQTGASQDPQYIFQGSHADKRTNASPFSGYTPTPVTYRQQDGILHTPTITTHVRQPQPTTYLPPPQGFPQRSDGAVRQPTPPPLPLHKHWDAVIKSFLQETGLTQTLRGFEADILVLNSDWEQKIIPPALDRLMKDLTQLTAGAYAVPAEAEPLAVPLEDRKLEYLQFSPDVSPRTPTTVTKSISRFLAQSRARNDASNRQEFLLSSSEKRQRLDENGGAEPGKDIKVASCARTDAKTQNRDLQMKYDIAKNEDGPLRKTVRPQENTLRDGDNMDAAIDSGDGVTADRYPALDERLRNIEAHVAVRYVPSPPATLLDRLKFLENHLIHLEKEYPPWAALHFNQPNRGWPPPPRPTPIIVPSHLTSSNPTLADRKSLLINTSAPAQFKQGFPTPGDSSSDDIESASSTPKHKAKQSGRSTKSSLHRAVMERLEVQRAMNDLAGVPESSNSAQ